MRYSQEVHYLIKAVFLNDIIRLEYLNQSGVNAWIPEWLRVYSFGMSKHLFLPKPIDSRLQVCVAFKKDICRKEGEAKYSGTMTSI